MFKTITSTRETNITIYFEILTIKLYILYILNTHVKFRANRSINLFLYKILDYNNLKFKHLINDIVINLRSFGNFTNIKNTRKKKCNPTIALLKFTYKIYIYIY